jgi:hypothetical protein
LEVVGIVAWVSRQVLLLHKREDIELPVMSAIQMASGGLVDRTFVGMTKFTPDELTNAEEIRQRELLEQAAIWVESKWLSYTSWYPKIPNPLERLCAENLSEGFIVRGEVHCTGMS